MEKPKKQARAEAMSRYAIKEMLRNACNGERMGKETEEKVADELYALLDSASRSYAACRAYAWEGLGVAYELRARISSLGIGATLGPSKNEMAAPPSHVL